MNADGLKAISAELNYLSPAARDPVTYLFEPPEGTPRENYDYDVRVCAIRDGRPIGDMLELDRDGFVLRKHKSAADLSNDEEVRAVYYLEAQSLLKELLGAREVVVFDHAIRKRDPSRPKLTFGREHSTLQPVGRIHCDYTPSSGPKRFRDILGEQAQAYAGRRFCQVNLWRPIKAPLYDAPLAVCAAWSISPEDLVRGELRYPNRKGEFFLARYNATHRWFYFPVMQPDEVLIFKGFDSDSTKASFTLHSAFENPEMPDDAPPRQSIEVRTFAIF